MTDNLTTLEQRQLVVIVRAIAETIAESGPLGAPASSVYLALQAFGLGMDTYKSVIGSLKSAGLVREANHTLYWTPGERSSAQPNRQQEPDDKPKWTAADEAALEIYEGPPQGGQS